MNADRTKVQGSVAALPQTTNSLHGCLGRWSIGKGCDEQVSDVYVAFGFNVTVTGFISLGIDLRESPWNSPLPYFLPPSCDAGIQARAHLHSTLTDPNMPLDECLGEDPSSAVLWQCIPRVKQVVCMPLMGSKAK